MERFNVIVHDLKKYLEDLGTNAQWYVRCWKPCSGCLLKAFFSAPFIPVCGLSGDNLVELSPKSSWYAGLALNVSAEGNGGMTFLDSLDES